MVPNGIFITLEGPDGSGKSTQVENIKEFFTKAGRDVVVSREPGGTPISEKLRGIVLDADHSEMDDVTEMFIYAAAAKIAAFLAPSIAIDATGIPGGI